ncbi:MAG: hypothetical protein V8Q30_11065 [Acutalibacteraceae bacterium]
MKSEPGHRQAVHHRWPGFLCRSLPGRSLRRRWPCHGPGDEITAENAVTRPDIIGHFDLIIKNNAGGRLFDEESRQYRQAALESLHRCLDTGAVFELNTGGIFRKYRSTPYPADFLLRELCAKHARMTINADAHETAALRFWFDEALELLETVGFGSVWVWENGRIPGERPPGSRR